MNQSEKEFFKYLIWKFVKTAIIIIVTAVVTTLILKKWKKQLNNQYLII